MSLKEHNLGACGLAEWMSRDALPAYTAYASCRYPAPIPPVQGSSARWPRSLSALRGSAEELRAAIYPQQTHLPAQLLWSTYKPYKPWTALSSLP